MSSPALLGPAPVNLTPTNSRATPYRTILIAILAFAVCSIASAVRSKGFLESDGGTHYLYARHALQEPHYFVNVWGRPLCTGIYAIPAAVGGLIGARLTSLALAIACALVAYRIAANQGFRCPVLALIFTLGQPLLFLHSFAELTELPFAAVIGLAFLAHQRKRWGTMALLVSISPLGRPEGFGFVLLAAIALVAHRRWLALLLLPAGILAWSIAGPILSGQTDIPWYRWLIANWPYESNSVYPRGPIWHFAMLLPMLVGPFALPAVLIGMWRGLRGGRLIGPDHRRRVQWLIAALPLAILLGHSALYALGKMASNGELRYLLVVAPLWGVLAASGWEWVFARLHWHGAVRWAALAAVAPGCVNYAWRVLPLEQSVSWNEAQRLCAWYAKSPLSKQYPHILTNHPGVFYFLDLSPTDHARVVQWSKDAVAHPQPGTILFWDPEFCLRNADASRVVPLQDVIAAGWNNDPIAEMRSNVNNPPPWANYKILNPPKEPKDKSLQNTPMLWHVFESRERD